MKTKLFLLLPALALAACSSSDDVATPTPDATRSAIDFKTFVNKGTRTAADITTDNITEFLVYAKLTPKSGVVQPADAVNFFRGVAKNTTTTPATWDYQDTQYWHTGIDYKFYAYAPLSVFGPNVANTDTDATHVGASVWKASEPSKVYVDNNTGETDILFAKAENTNVLPVGNDAVELTFDHALSKVDFEFRETFFSTADTKQGFTIHDLKLAHTWKSGTFDADALNAARPWTFNSNGGFTTFSYTMPTTLVKQVAAGADHNSVTSDYKYAIPAVYRQSSTAGGTDNRIVVSFQIDYYADYNGTVHTANIQKSISTDQVFEAGYYYHFVIELNENNIFNAFDPIQVKLKSVNPWNKPASGSIATLTPATAGN